VLSNDIVTELKEIVGSDNITTEDAALQSGSKDCYYFSPVLTPELDGKYADVIIKPANKHELKAIIKTAVANGIPITPRGGGTGNYGQGVPMSGGIMINTKRMNQSIEITAEHAAVECGMSLWHVEKAARSQGGELKMFPSTITTSSAAGFITGGSGGIGSIHSGLLAEPGNILSATIMTIEPEPQELVLDTPKKLKKVLHNCGLTAFVTEVDFALSPKTDWHQYVISFDTLEQAVTAAEQLAYDDDLYKRLCSVLEWPIPSYFKPLVKRDACPDGKSAVFLITDLTPELVAPYIEKINGTLSYHLAPGADDVRGFQIYDFTWNHTTLWAMKADESLTYLQEIHESEGLLEKLKQVKAKFNDDVSIHLEFLKTGGIVRPGGLSVVKFKSKEQLFSIIDYFESIGIRVSSPHTHYIDYDVRWYNPDFIPAKQEWDPNSLLNPGHFKALEESA